MKERGPAIFLFTSEEFLELNDVGNQRESEINRQLRAEGMWRLAHALRRELGSKIGDAFGL